MHPSRAGRRSKQVTSSRLSHRLANWHRVLRSPERGLQLGGEGFHCQDAMPGCQDANSVGFLGRGAPLSLSLWSLSLLPLLLVSPDPCPHPMPDCPWQVQEQAQAGWKLDEGMGDGGWAMVDGLDCRRDRSWTHTHTVRKDRVPHYVSLDAGSARAGVASSGGWICCPSLPSSSSGRYVLCKPGDKSGGRMMASGKTRAQRACARRSMLRGCCDITHISPTFDVAIYGWSWCTLLGCLPCLPCLLLPRFAHLDEFVRSSAKEAGTSLLRAESAGFGQSRIEPASFWGSSQAHPPTTNPRLGPKILVMGSLLHHTGTPLGHHWDTLGHAGPMFLTSCSRPTLPPTRSSPWRLSASGLHAMRFSSENFLCPGLSASILGVSHWSGTVQKHTLCSNWPAAAAFELIRPVIDVG